MPIIPEELESNLAHFTGSVEYTRAKYPGVNLLLTDGAKYLCDNAKCYWLMGVIASYQPKKLAKEEFQTWIIRVNETKSAVVTCDDGNGHILVEQHIPWTDFPSRELKLYAQRAEYPEPGLIVMLPSEY